MLRSALILVLLTGLAACASEPQPKEEMLTQPPPRAAYVLPPPPVLPGGGAFALTPVDFGILPGWQQDDPAAAIAAFRRSCDRLLRRPDSASLGGDGRYGRVVDWLPACEALGAPATYDARAARRYFETWFQPYMVSAGGRSEGLFTGYYEAEVEGALRPGGDYRWPLYGAPPDLVQASASRSYHDRAAIEAGALAGRGLELVWLNDLVDAFDLHIQGSAVVDLPDGTRRRIGFAGTNGLPFVGIGRLMLDRGYIGPGEATAQGVKAWLKAHPEEARALMLENPRYVFFRWIDQAGEGPVGAQGVPLTPGRSLAVDPAFLAYGLPVFLQSSTADGRPLNRLLVAQDTGGAIKGPVRGDLFWGTGAPALAEAGGMKQQGRYYLFLPKTLNRVARAG